MVAASHISSVYIISWYVAWGLLNFNDCCYHFKTTAWKLCSVSYSKLKTRLLGNCIEKETIHSILKTSEARLRSEVWDSLPPSWGPQNLLFVLRSWQDEKTSFSISLLSSNLNVSYYISKLFIFCITWISGGCMLKILWGHFVSTSSTARKTIETILMKLLRYRNDSKNWFRVD